MSNNILIPTLKFLSNVHDGQAVPIVFQHSIILITLKYLYYISEIPTMPAMC
jgi:hypothetical protein